MAKKKKKNKTKVVKLENSKTPITRIDEIKPEETQEQIVDEISFELRNRSYINSYIQNIISHLQESQTSLKSIINSIESYYAVNDISNKKQELTNLYNNITSTINSLNSDYNNVNKEVNL